MSEKATLDAVLARIRSGALNEAIRQAAAQEEADAYAKDDGPDAEEPDDDEDEPQAVVQSSARDPESAQIAAVRNQIVSTPNGPARSRLEVMLQNLMRSRAQRERQ